MKYRGGSGKSLNLHPGGEPLPSKKPDGDFEPMRSIASSCNLVFSFVLLLTLSAAPLTADIYFEDDFELYFDDLELELEGWRVVEVGNPTETTTFWTVLNPGGRANPPGEDGTPSTGIFLVSDSDQGDATSNPTGSGMSHDIWSPEIDLADAQNKVWLHFDCAAILNNNGKAVFDVDVSIDGGETWVNAFRRVAPLRTEAEPFASTENSDGYFGRVHVDITEPAAGQPEVVVRWRHFEPSWDWWIAIDNVVVDDVVPPQGGEVFLLGRQDFAAGIPPDWELMSLSEPPNEGTETWHTTDKGLRSVIEHNAGLFPYMDGHGVFRLEPPFAILDSDADPDPAEDEYLMTPVIDCSEAEEVYLHYKDEILATGAIQEVLFSIDGGATFEPVPIFSYSLGAGFDPGEDPFYAERVFSVPAAAFESKVVFAWHYQAGGNEWWWAVDDVYVTGTGEGLDAINCASRNFRTEGFDPNSASVTMHWNSIDGDTRHEILANGEVIAAELAADAETYVDEAPPAGGAVIYSIRSYAGEEARTECEAPSVEPRRCPAELSCCYDIGSGEVTLSWLNGVNIEGRSWRIRRNGVPRSSVALVDDTYTDRITRPGVYEYTLELNGGNAAQCPGLPLSCSVVVTGEGIAFYEDFECYTDDASLTANGWEMLLAGNAPDDSSQFSILNPGERGNPPGENGQPSTGKFLISDNDFGGADLAPGSGGSFDLVSPSFSCAGLEETWLHMDTAIVMNNNGSLVVDVDVSADGGNTWTNVFRRAGAARAGVDPLPQVELSEDEDLGPQEGNADGFFGRLHIDLSEVAAGQDDVKFRVRHFEPSWEWWVAIDNVQVDSNGVSGGEHYLLETDFNGGIPEDWAIESFDDLAPWSGNDDSAVSLLNYNGGLFPDESDGRRLHYFDREFANVSCSNDVDLGIECANRAGNETLMTPPLDLSERTAVYLHVRSSTLMTSAVAEILLSLDGGVTFEDEPVFSYTTEAGFLRADGNSEVVYGDYIFPVPRAVGEADVVFGFHFDNPNQSIGWWAIDDVSITADGGPAVEPPPPPPEEICDNGADDDEDGLADCDDPDCADEAACQVVQGPVFNRGDPDDNGAVQLTDGIFILNFLFLGGSAPACFDSADADNNGAVQLTDGIFILNFLFLGGEGPVEPGTAATPCGEDPAEPADDIGCDQYTSCG